MLLELVTEPLARILDRGEPAGRVLRATLRANPQLDAVGRRELADAVLGTCVFRARVDHHLIAAGVEPSARARAALYLLLFRDSRETDEAWLDDAASTPLPTDPFERLVIERSLPVWLARRLVDERGAVEVDALMAAMNVAGPVVARANTLKTDREGLMRTLSDEAIGGTPGELTEWSVHLQGRPNIHGAAAWRAGMFEVQDEGSQLIALATGARPTQTVVDLCAGRGGKTLALAAMMNDAGRLIALDVDEARLRDMRPRLSRAGVTCVDASTLDDTARAPSALHSRADVVLVDAPCSELGTLRRSPDLRWKLTPSTVTGLPALQRSILHEGARLVRPGGRLIYATCTLLRAENEDVVAAFVDDHGDFAVEQERTLLPHVDGTDGFFIATLRRA